jgi:hypothetical protein
MKRSAGVEPACLNLHEEGRRNMRAIFASALLVPALALTSIPADAKGCIKGAIVGGVAGHYAHHHGLIGAATGCLVNTTKGNTTADRIRRLTNRTKGGPHG